MYKKVLIIAEAGVNHNGSIDIAKILVDEAKEAGADYVKFQTFRAEKLVSRGAKKAEYQKATTDKEETQYQMIKKLEMSLEMHNILIEYCKEKGIRFLSSPFDEDSVDLLDKLNVDVFKVPSGEIDNLPLLSKIGRLNKQVIISTGMSNLSDIEKAIEILTKSGTERENITVLHCNTEYPTPMKDVNLLAMNTIKNAFKIKVGYSDHTLGIEIPIAAVALGATIIEKHFTLDKNMEGPDHKASLEPYELRKMVESIRNIEITLGNGIKELSESEMKNKPIARKSIVAKTEILKGSILSEDNLAIKRPGNGISPLEWNQVLGKKAIRDFTEDELIELC